MTSRPDTIETIGVDTGGTFTDFVILHTSGEMRVDKRPSVPHDPSRPVLEGFADLTPGSSVRMVHGTTVATNALLQHKVAKTALITTAGFEDVLEIGRQNRPVLYELHPKKPPALIPRSLRFGVRERILHDGSIRKPVDESQVRQVLEQMRESRVEAIAVCLLHSYVNAVHEESIGKMARAMGFAVSLSCEVLPEFREYERTATVAVNACLRPVMGSYLGRLEQNLGQAHLHVMQSAGGIIPAPIAGRLPVHTVLSGPAGGVIASAHKAEQAGFDKIITFDMGGTSTDVSLYDREPTLSTEKIIAGWPIRIPVIDIHTVAAGGGSIAYRDTGGSLKVGPISAGADPGPICYGTAEDMTVTDAHLALGRLEPSSFLGGRMAIHPERVPPRLDRLARSLGLDGTAAAEGIVTVANAVMERAIRVISVQRGYDPRDFTLVSFGGAGGLHAVDLARSLGIPRIMVPRDAGVFSAFGMVVADVVRDYSRTVLKPSSRASHREIDRIMEQMVDEGVKELCDDGIDRSLITAQASLDMRYQGQSYEITVPFAEDATAAFHRLHEHAYGYRRTDSIVEIVNVRIRLVAALAKPPDTSRTRGGAGAGPVPIGSARPIYEGTAVDAAVYDRDDLGPGMEFQGPALVLEATATTYLPPGSRCAVDGAENIIVAP